MGQYHESMSLNIINDIKGKIASEPKIVKTPPIFTLAVYRAMPKLLQKMMKDKIVKTEKLYFCGLEFLIARNQKISLEIALENRYKLNDLKICKQVVNNITSETKTISAIDSRVSCNGSLCIIHFSSVKGF